MLTLMVGSGLTAFAGGALANTVALNGTGSSFAAPAITQWNSDVSHAPYSLTMNYTSASSGVGRYQFTNETVDFAVSDTGYVNASTGTTPPSFPFQFIPVTAAGVAFMYNIPGLSQTLQLTSYTACLAMTGQVQSWDDPVFHQSGANPGVTLPNVPIRPITESDPAGTNYVLEEYCIAQQPAVWAKYASNVAGTLAQGVSISPTTPGSNWVPPGNGYDEQSTAAVASTVASNSGGIGAVQENYAVDSGFTGSNPAKSVAAVQNASGVFTLPTPVDVASALAYATQRSDGTHVLNFSGAGPHVYNPSTYSYLLTPTTGWAPSKGAAMSAYVNYVLTLGQQKAPSMGFASLGLSLERYGIDNVINKVPGAVSPTAAESQAYACGDLTPTEVQAGQTTPTCGVTNGTPPPPPPGAGATTTSVATSASSTTTTVAKRAVAKKTVVKKKTTVTTTTFRPNTPTTIHSATSTTVAVAGSGGATTVTTQASSGSDPSVTLATKSSLAYTGSDPSPLIAAGVSLVLFGFLGRRRLQRPRPLKRSQ